MVLHQEKPYGNGMNMVVRDAGNTKGMLLDYGTLKLAEGEIWENSADKKRALMLISGNVIFSWGGKTREAVRASCFDENPEALQVPAGMAVSLTGGSGGAELCFEACVNEQDFLAVYYGRDDIRNDVFGAGSLNETSIRTV